MELRLRSLEENYLFVYRILTKDNLEILKGSMYREEVILNISKEHYNKPLKLIIENEAFAKNHLKSIFHLAIQLLAGLGGANDIGFLGKPITYIYNFTLFGNGIIEFHKEHEKPFNSLLSIESSSQQKVVYKKQYKKWIIYTFIPLELLFLLLAIIFGGASKEYLILGVIPFLIVQIGVFLYVFNFKKKWKLN